MKRESARLSKLYHAALRTHLERGGTKDLLTAISLGRRAVTMGLGTLDVARMHEEALIELVLPNESRRARAAKIERAAAFFAQAITPIEQTRRGAHETNARLDELSDLLRQRTAELATSKRRLREQIGQRRIAEEALRKNREHYAHSLDQSRGMQDQLRSLSRQLLSAQEEERRRISRDLHDVVAQTLTGINVQLTTLKRQASHNSKGIDRNIARTQRLVEESVNIVHRFARELRPTVLDDLGLIPALHTFLKHFRGETGIRVSLSTFAAVEEVDDNKRTVLYRVAQEALTNVARHADASRAEVLIQRLDGGVCMKISDNGTGFREEHARHAKRKTRLGLLGMRERLEMVGGHFSVNSSPGKGTMVIAKVPLTHRELQASMTPARQY